MRAYLITAAAVLTTLSFSTAYADDDGAIAGAAGGAATGAVVGGPIGAVVGGAAGAIIGGSIEPPPEKVVTYVQSQPVPQSIVIDTPIVVGEPIPKSVTLVTVPDSPQYAYTVVNNQRVIVDPQTYTVVQVLN
ncbi:hypothetical protein DEM27_32745 [Metarhizobium album]|uniref:DUF1236 domain-containing protein n=1 Tax=Metarhizobium album TaxID=2182425 RepID=A0A2U2DFN4_9HYPH|nr:hypothetical protein DEM27_32745 [Rhizobium album]